MGAYKPMEASKQKINRPRLHPQSWRELRQLVELHGLDDIQEALDYLKKTTKPESMGV
jgi:hypothetical protein